MRSRLTLASLCLFSLTLPAAEIDWPSWRGPKRDNISPDKGLLQKWPKGGPELLWKNKGLGSGYSSLTLAGDRIFTVGNKDRKSYLVCLDRKDGAKLWSAEVGPQGGNLGCTPTVDGDRVYAIGQGGNLVCVGIEKGDEIWRKHLKEDFDGKVGGWNYTESPLVDGDRLVCTPGAKDAMMVALDKKTGKLAWKAEVPFKNAEAHYSSIVIANVGGVKMYVQLSAAGVFGIRAKDGKFLWHYEKLGNNTANCPTPIVLGDRVFAAAGYGKGAALLALSVDDGEVTAKEVYFKQELNNKHGGVIVVGKKVYGDTDDSGNPYCADLDTGKRLWRKKDRSEGQGSVAMAYADGCLYCFYQNGVMALVDATADEYKETGWFKIPGGDGPSWAHPVIVGGKLYVRNGDMLFCYDVKGK